MTPSARVRTEIRRARLIGLVFTVAFVVSAVGSFIVDRTVFGAFCGLLSLACLRIAAEARDEIESWS